MARSIGVQVQSLVQMVLALAATLAAKQGSPGGYGKQVLKELDELGCGKYIPEYERRRVLSKDGTF